MNKFSAIFALVAGVTVAGSANAATLIQSAAFGFGEAAATVTVSVGNTDSATNAQTVGFGAISNFNPTLGTLNSVTFDISWSGEIEQSWSQSGLSTAHSVTWQSNIVFSPDSASSVNLQTVTNTSTPPVNLFPLNATTVREVSGTDSFSESDAALLALFSGPGSIASTIELENFVELTVTASGPVTATTRGCPVFGSVVCGVLSGNPLPQVRGILTVTYDYSEVVAQVPTPGMTALFGLALIGIGAARRRTR